MRFSSRASRRGFLAGVFGVAAAAAGGRVAAVAAQGGHDGWIKEVPGTKRCFFDFPRHMNGFGLVHIFNYLNTYAAAYGGKPGQMGAVGTFYGIGPGASIAMGFNDAMWAKYALGEYHGLKDAAGRPYTRNPFHRPTKADAALLFQQVQSPRLAPFEDVMVASGIESLQKQGTKFLMCANALGAWALELAARGKGEAGAIEPDLRANLLPGVTIVPAMVVAIEQAQAAGIAYNRQ
ncbi:MAG: hypothetical protein AB1635_13320 [Acidobacteriota bacterium]